MLKQHLKKVLILGLLISLGGLLVLSKRTTAWFSDSVIGVNNTIKAGELKVSASYGESVDTNTPLKDGALFEKNLIWEPDAYFFRYLTVENTGNLPLKYFLEFNKTKEASEELKLDSQIKVFIFDANENIDLENFSAETYPNHLSLKALLDKKVDLDFFTKATILDPSGENNKATHLLLLYMDPLAGNDFQNKQVSDFTVNVHATQVSADDKVVLSE